MPALAAQPFSFLTLRFKDVLLVVLCLVFTYLLRVRDSFLLLPDFEIPVDVSLFPNGASFDAVRDLPRPLVTDLDGDRVPDLLFVDNDFKLKSFDRRFGVENDDDDDDPGCREKPLRLRAYREAALPAHYAETGRRSLPVALATGYVKRHQSMIEIRRQIVVVVFDTWHVIAFDSELNLLWETQLLNVPHDVSQDYYVKAMTILVAPSGSHGDGNGVVIVGGSFEHLAHRGANHELKHHGEGGGRHHPRPGSRKEEDLTHFTTFALDASNGSVRWHHLPGDFESKREDDLFSHPVHWKLALRPNGMHRKQVPWSSMTDVFLRHLPHSWTNRGDTVARLEAAKRTLRSEARKSVGGRHGGAAANVIAKNFEAHLPAALEYDFGPHSPEDHAADANSVVIKYHQGIEILDLTSGEPVARLPLSASTSVTWADLDDDDVVDEVSLETMVESPSETERETTSVEPECFLKAKNSFLSSSSSSPSPLVFNVSVCRLPVFQRLHFDLFHDGYRKAPSLPVVSSFSPPPVVVPSMAHRTGLWHHLTGYSLHRGSHGKDIVVVLPDGRVTSVGSRGELHWQTATASSWGGSEGDDAFAPHLLPFARRVFGKTDSVVVSGSHFLSLLDLADGSILAEFGLPCRPSAGGVIVTDFSGDGLNDVLVSCPSGVSGFRLRAVSAKSSTALVGVIVVALVFVLNSVAKEKRKEKEDFDARRNAKKFLEQFED